MIAGQNVGLECAKHLKEDPSVSPFPESREPRPEQCTNGEDLPDSDDVQDISRVAQGADVLYDIWKVRKVHEGPGRDFQNQNGGAR